MNRSAGYTLIEVLIMLAVTAILSATVLETVRASTANGVRIEQAARNATQDYITLASIRRAVEASQPDYRDGENTFLGDETRFRALTSNPITSTHMGVQPYALELVNEAEGARLVYSQNGERFSVQFWPGARGRWSYFGEATIEPANLFQSVGRPRDRSWSAQWPARNASDPTLTSSFYQPLPLAVRAEIEMPDGQGRVIVFDMPVTAAPRQPIEEMLGLQLQ